MKSDQNVAGIASSQSTRRDVLRWARVATLGASLAPMGTRRVAAHDGSNPSVTAFANVALPPDVGQTGHHVYVPATGHTLRGSFLDYWRANGAASVYGNPISEPFEADNGYYSQAFENVVFQYRPEFFYTHDPIMRPLPISELVDRRENLPWVSGGRRAGSGSRRSAAWRQLDRGSDEVARVLERGGMYVEATGHTISGDILAWYTFNEGPFYLGAPLTEPLAERETTIQYFEGGLVMAGEEGVSLAPLAKELASKLGINTTPAEQGDLPAYDELLFWTADTPSPLGDPYAPGPKWIEVSISQQTLWAYQGDTLIHQTLVSTGLDPNLTELGMFHIRLKYLEQDLGGFTDSTGEVIGFGDAPDGTVPYLVEDVPHVMYFNMEAEALHGTYWHNNFGAPMSHGCVNLPLDVAEWIYGWAPIGTGVWIHE